MSQENRKNESLQALGHDVIVGTDYNPAVLETFENMHPEHDYWVKFNCPEFTTLCPITGQPDFAEIPRGLRQHHHERPHPADGPEIH